MHLNIKPIIIPVGNIANPAANTNPISCHAPWLEFDMFGSLFALYRAPTLD